MAQGKPTAKQKKLLSMIPESSTLSEAMIKAGYSEATAKNPKQILETDGWISLLETVLPDNLLLQKHVEGLYATRIHTSHTEPDKEIPDYAVRHKYLETAYKVKGKVVDVSLNKTEVTTKIVLLDE